MKGSVLFFGAALSSAAIANAASTYSIKPLDSSGTTDVIVDGVNTSGQIVGYTFDGDGFSHATLWSAATGAGAPLAAMGATDRSEAYRINNNGQIVGKAFSDAGNFHASLWNASGGTPTDLGTLGGSFSFAMDINDNGVVAGSSGAAHGQHAFVWTQAGGLVDMGSKGPNSNSAIAGWNGINNNGKLVGTSYIIFSPYHASMGQLGDTAPTDISPQLQFSNGMGLAINDAGTMVGWQNPGGHGAPHAAIFDGRGGSQDLGTLGPLETDSWASDINEDGIIVGRSFGNDPDTGESINKAFIYQDGQMTELRTLLDNPNGWTTIFEANAISDNGLIVGTGIYNGEITGFVMAPTPEPTSIGLVGLAGVTLLSRRRRI